MPDQIQRYESMLFNYETVGRTDFRGGEIKRIIKTEYKEKSTCLRIRSPPLKDLHTLTDWKIANVPFGLFTKPKDIVCTNPRNIQKVYDTYGKRSEDSNELKQCGFELFLNVKERPVDKERELVQMRRPRLVMTPATSMDDIQDKRSRKLLIDDMYTTTLDVTMRDTATGKEDFKAPLVGNYAPANPIALEKFLPPYVSPEWRMNSVFWDNAQLRAYCNPTRHFWLARTPKCQECDAIAARQALKKTRLMKP